MTDIDPNVTAADPAAATIAKRLLRESRRGSLASLKPDGGAPYCSLVAVASHPDGSPLLLISRLAIHTQNLLADRRVSLLLSAAGEGDPLQQARIMISGRAEILDGDDKALARRRYLAVHPSAEMFVDFPDFLFVKINLESVHLVAGFGRIRDLSRPEILTDLKGADAMLDAEEGAIAHMNDDHADALNLYATQLRDVKDSAWRCTGIDPDGIDLESDGTALRIEFPSRVSALGALRATLAAMAAEARARAGGGR